MYFRIIVKQHDQFFFRTSRLHSVGAMLKANSLLNAACVDQDYAGCTVEVLQVADGLGSILTAEEMKAHNDQFLAEAETASETAQPL